MSEILDIHKPFIDWLRATRVPFINARPDRESTIAEGHPDFTLLARNHCLMIEMKTEKGRLRPEQARRIAELEAAGNIVHVVRDVGVAIELAAAWMGMLPREPSRVIEARDGEQLYQFGDGVWRTTPRGNVWVRVKTPADFALPRL